MFAWQVHTLSVHGDSTVTEQERRDSTPAIIGDTPVNPEDLMFADLRHLGLKPRGNGANLNNLREYVLDWVYCVYIEFTSLWLSIFFWHEIMWECCIEILGEVTITRHECGWHAHGVWEPREQNATLWTLPALPVAKACRVTWEPSSRLRSSIVSWGIQFCTHGFQCLQQKFLAGKCKSYWSLFFLLYRISW